MRHTHLFMTVALGLLVALAGSRGYAVNELGFQPSGSPSATVTGKIDAGTATSGMIQKASQVRSPVLVPKWLPVSAAVIQHAVAPAARVADAAPEPRATAADRTPEKRVSDVEAALPERKSSVAHSDILGLDAAAKLAVSRGPADGKIDGAVADAPADVARPAAVVPASRDVLGFSRIDVSPTQQAPSRVADDVAVDDREIDSAPASIPARNIQPSMPTVSADSAMPGVAREPAVIGEPFSHSSSAIDVASDNGSVREVPVVRAEPQALPRLVIMDAPAAVRGSTSSEVAVPPVVSRAQPVVQSPRVPLATTTDSRTATPVARTSEPVAVSRESGPAVTRDDAELASRVTTTVDTSVRQAEVAVAEEPIVTRDSVMPAREAEVTRDASSGEASVVAGRQAVVDQVSSVGSLSTGSASMGDDSHLMRPTLVRNQCEAQSRADIFPMALDERLLFADLSPHTIADVIRVGDANKDDVAILAFDPVGMTGPMLVVYDIESQMSVRYEAPAGSKMVVADRSIVTADDSRFAFVADAATRIKDDISRAGQELSKATMMRNGLVADQEVRFDSIRGLAGKRLSLVSMVAEDANDDKKADLLFTLRTIEERGSSIVYQLVALKGSENEFSYKLTEASIDDRPDYAHVTASVEKPAQFERVGDGLIREKAAKPVVLERLDSGFKNADDSMRFQCECGDSALRMMADKVAFDASKYFIFSCSDQIGRPVVRVVRKRQSEPVLTVAVVTAASDALGSGQATMDVSGVSPGLQIVTTVSSDDPDLFVRDPSASMCQVELRDEAGRDLSGLLSATNSCEPTVRLSGEADVDQSMVATVKVAGRVVRTSFKVAVVGRQAETVEIVSQEEIGNDMLMVEQNLPQVSDPAEKAADGQSLELGSPEVAADIPTAMTFAMGGGCTLDRHQGMTHLAMWQLLMTTVPLWILGGSRVRRNRLRRRHQTTR